MDAKPLWLLPELTCRCPLHAPYCPNPLAFAGPRFKRELTTEEWCRVFREARALGVLQLGLSGGEPTLRPDLEELVRTAHDLGLYSSLITSAYRRSEEHTSELQSRLHLVCRLLLEKKNKGHSTQRTDTLKQYMLN